MPNAPRCENGRGQRHPSRGTPSYGHTAPLRRLEQQAAVRLKQRDTGSGRGAIGRGTTDGGGRGQIFRMGNERGEGRARNSTRTQAPNTALSPSILSISAAA